MLVSVYRHMVGAFHVSSVYAVATTPVWLVPFGTKRQIMNIPALEPGRKPTKTRLAPTGIALDTRRRRNSCISSVITGLVSLAQRQEIGRKQPARC